MSLSQLLNCDFVKPTDIINKSLLIREMNEFNMYYNLTRYEYKNINTIVY